VKQLFIILLVLILVMISANSVLGQENFVPTMINYQGFLTDPSGTALNNPQDITFWLYDTSSGGLALWTETHNAVNVENGLFNVLLGSVTALTAADLTGERYLAIQVGTDAPMGTRIKLASVAYSLHADQSQNSNKLDNKDSDDFVKVEGDTMVGTLVVPGTLEVTGKLDFPEFFGWQWHDIAESNHSSQGWVTAVDIVSPGILLMVQATGGSYYPENQVKITIDGTVWRTYTGQVVNVGALGWLIVDDSEDDNSAIITIMPFKAFNTRLKVELYNHSSSHESDIRVNYLTP